MSSDGIRHAERLARARLALEGLSVGDAFGETFFGNSISAERRLQARKPSSPPWIFTDDTAMAIAVFECLAEHHGVDADWLAERFAISYAREPDRGYGGTAHSILRAIGAGLPWQDAAAAAFDGMGSMGNGAAMRVAPVGAYFADDLDTVVAQARRSAEVTHAHPDGQAGAIAIAVAAAAAWNLRDSTDDQAGRELIELVYQYTPDGETRSRIQRVLIYPFDREPSWVAGTVGNGTGVIACDTVPYCLWCAARHFRSYSEALWTAVSVGGDMDTNAAIVGGIVALSAGLDSIPPLWRESREALPIMEQP